MVILGCGIRHPGQHLDRLTPVVADKNITLLMVIRVVLRTPTGMESGEQSAGGNPRDIDLRRHHRGLVPSVLCTWSVIGVIPLIRVRHRYDVFGQCELGTRLVPRHLHPPIVVGKTPAGPFRHPVVVRETVLVIVRQITLVILAVARNTRAIHLPAGWPFRRPGCVALHRLLVHVWPQLNAIKILIVNRHLKLNRRSLLTLGTIGVGQGQFILGCGLQCIQPGRRDSDDVFLPLNRAFERLAVQCQRNRGVADRGVACVNRDGQRRVRLGVCVAGSPTLDERRHRR